MLGQVGIWGVCRVAHGLFVVFLKVFLSSFSAVAGHIIQGMDGTCQSNIHRDS